MCQVILPTNHRGTTAFDLQLHEHHEGVQQDQGSCQNVSVGLAPVGDTWEKATERYGKQGSNHTSSSS